MEFALRAGLVCIFLCCCCTVSGAGSGAEAAHPEEPMWHSTKPADGGVMPARPAQPMAQAAPAPAVVSPAPAAPATVAPTRAAAPAPVQTASASGARRVDADDFLYLQEHDWTDRVADEPALWVSIARQRAYLIRGSEVLWEAPCGTATNGAGARVGSNQTPLGWHSIAEKIGDGAPWGQVFRSRQPTREIWKPGMDTTEDLVLTRILWLEGLEPGRNKGTDNKGVLVDSRRRYIYIHGTNGEDRIGEPSSHGCIRLLNDDVIRLFNMVPEGTLVLITD
jgi:lipoprotein-anchoring transpeptidase ErfK/SrfK